jgi:hypothetical protein
VSVNMAKEEEFVKLLGQFTDFLLKNNPRRATLLGIHEYDDEVADFAPKAMEKRVERIGDFQKKFRAISHRYLSASSRVDLDLAMGRADYEELIFTKLHLPQQLPDMYLDEIIFGISPLITRPFAPPRERGVSALRRMVQSGTILKQAQKNLQNPPAIFTQSAILKTKGAIDFFRHAVLPFGDMLVGVLQEAYREEATQSIARLEGFTEWLEKDLLQNPRGISPVANRCSIHFCVQCIIWT